MAIVFTADEYGEGGNFILKAFKEKKAKASFFLTGRFYKTPNYKKLIQQLASSGHYLGAHSDQHLLYCDWTNRDSLLVTKAQFNADLDENYKAMKQFGITNSNAKYFLPPYEWYNDTIASWTSEKGLQLINYTGGTLSHADYTTIDLKNYRSSEEIMQSILNYERSHPSGLSGFILLMHLGAGEKRTDKFYNKLPALIDYLKERKYTLVRVDDLLEGITDH